AEHGSRRSNAQRQGDERCERERGTLHHRAQSVTEIRKQIVHGQPVRDRVGGTLRIWRATLGPRAAALSSALTATRYEIGVRTGGGDPVPPWDGLSRMRQSCVRPTDQ